MQSGERVQAKSVSVRHRNQHAKTRALSYRLVLREAGVALGRGLALAVLRTVMVPWRAAAGAGVGDVSAYFFVVGQMSRHG